MLVLGLWLRHSSKETVSQFERVFAQSSQICPFAALNSQSPSQLPDLRWPASHKVVSESLITPALTIAGFAAQWPPSAPSRHAPQMHAAATLTGKA